MLSISSTASETLDNLLLDVNVMVTIPCYNVEKTILGVVESIPPFVSRIILVNDASQDNTSKILDNLSDNRIEVLHLLENQGVGGAVMQGYARALELGADVIVKMDGDGQMDPDYLAALITPILCAQADYSKGNRFMHAVELGSMPLIRRIGNAGLSFLTKAASGYWNIFDPSNGYTAIHKSILKLLDFSRLHPRYGFETSMLMELALHRAVVQDVYIPAVYGDEESSLQIHQVFFVLLKLLVSRFYRRIIIQYFLRDFNAGSIFILFGTILFVFSLFWGGFFWIKALLTQNDTPLGTVVIAMITLIFGVQFLLQAVVLDIQTLPSKPVQQSNRYQLNR